MKRPDLPRRLSLWSVLLLACLLAPRQTPSLAPADAESTRSERVGIQRITAVDRDEDGDLDGVDLELAFGECESETGCAIDLLPAVYENVQVVVPPSIIQIRGDRERSVLRGPLRPRNAPILHRRPADGGWPTEFRSFRIDGLKQLLEVSPGMQQNCIRIGDPTNKQLAGGSIVDVTCENVAQEGFFLDDAPGWRIVGNRIRFIGCWDSAENKYRTWRPNGVDAGRMSCGGWSRSQKDEFNQPGRKTNGVGIEITRRSHRVVIEDNIVQYFTKIGIQGIAGARTDFGDYPTSGRVAGNLVEWGLTGIAMVRTHGWIIEDNIVRDMAPPWMFGNVGKGFGCAHGGDGTRFLRNRAERTGGVGFDVGCNCRVPRGSDSPRKCDIIVDSNVTVDSCLLFGRGVGAIDISGARDGVLQGGLTLRGNRVERTNCDASIRISDFSDVVMEGPGSRYEAGRKFGILVVRSPRSSLDAGPLQGRGNGIGVFVDAESPDLRIDGMPTGDWEALVKRKGVTRPPRRSVR